MGLLYRSMQKITPGMDGSWTDANGNQVLGRGLLIGSDGTLKVKWATGRKETLPAGVFATGHIHDVELQYIYSEGTTASNILVGFDVRM